MRSRYQPPCRGLVDGTLRQELSKSSEAQESHQGTPEHQPIFDTGPWWLQIRKHFLKTRKRIVWWIFRLQIKHAMKNDAIKTSNHAHQAFWNHARISWSNQACNAKSCKSKSCNTNKLASHPIKIHAITTDHFKHSMQTHASKFCNSCNPKQMSKTCQSCNPKDLRPKTCNSCKPKSCKAKSCNSMSNDDVI